MEQNLENNIKFKDKLKNLYDLNKRKFFLLIIILFFISLAAIFLEFRNEKKNILVSEKYVQAGLYLTLDKKEEARILYEEIILSKNKFYSILSLNSIIEKNLISDSNKILEYFTILESSSSKENKELISLKKALYLIKISDVTNGKKILKDLANNSTSLKNIARDLLKD